MPMNVYTPKPWQVQFLQLVFLICEKHGTVLLKIWFHTVIAKLYMSGGGLLLTFDIMSHCISPGLVSGSLISTAFHIGTM